MRKLINNSTVIERDVVTKNNYNVISIDTTSTNVVNRGLTSDDIFLSYDNSEITLSNMSVYDYKLNNTKHAAIGDTHAMNVANKVNSLFSAKMPNSLLKSEWSEIANEIISELNNDHGYVTEPGAISTSGNNKLDERFLKRFTDAIMKDTGNDNSKLETLGQLMNAMAILNSLEESGNRLNDLDKNGVIDEEEKRKVANEVIAGLEAYRKMNLNATTNIAKYGVNTKVDPNIEYPDYTVQNNAKPNRQDGVYPYGITIDTRTLGHDVDMSKIPARDLTNGKYPYEFVGGDRNRWTSTGARDIYDKMQNIHVNHMSHDRKSLLEHLGIIGDSGLRDFLSDPLKLEYNPHENTDPNSGFSIALGSDFVNADNLADGFLQAGKDALGQLTDKLGDVAGQVKGAIGDVCNKFTEGLGALKGDFLDLMGGMGITDILAKFGIILDKDHLGKMRDKSDIYKAGLDKAKQAKANAVDGAKKMKDAGIKQFNNLTQKILDKVNSMADNLINSAMSAVTGFVNGLMDKVAGFVTGFINKIKSFVKQLTDTISNLKEQFTNIYHNIKNSISNIAGTIEDLKNFKLSDISLKSIESAFHSLETITNSISSLANSIVNSACSLLQSVLDMIPIKFDWPHFHLPDLKFNIGKIVIDLSMILPDISLHINFAFNTNFHLPNCPALSDSRLGSFGTKLNNLLNKTNAKLDHLNDKLSFQVHVNEDYTSRLVHSADKFIHKTAEQLTDDLYKHLGIDKSKIDSDQKRLDSESGREYSKSEYDIPSWVKPNPLFTNAKKVDYMPNTGKLSSELTNTITSRLKALYNIPTSGGNNTGNVASSSNKNLSPVEKQQLVSITQVNGENPTSHLSSTDPKLIDHVSTDKDIEEMIKNTEFTLSLLMNPETKSPTDIVGSGNNGGSNTGTDSTQTGSKFVPVSSVDEYLKKYTDHGYVDNTDTIQAIWASNPSNSNKIDLLEPYLRVAIIY